MGSSKVVQILIIYLHGNYEVEKWYAGLR